MSAQQLKAAGNFAPFDGSMGSTSSSAASGAVVALEDGDDVRLDLQGLQLERNAAEPALEDGQQEQQQQLQNIIIHAQNPELDDNYFSLEGAEITGRGIGGASSSAAAAASAGSPSSVSTAAVAAATASDALDKKDTGGSEKSATSLVPRPPPGRFAELVRSLSTPMMGEGVDKIDDWVGAEDPDWKANHQLSWAQLTDLREIGKGLTCTVYTARIPGRKSKVIAKVARQRNKGRLEDQAERQLEAEFNVLRQVNHPHVVELLGAGFTPEGRRFLLLEHLPEGTLGTFHALSAREEMRGPSAYRVLKQGFRRLTKDLSYTLGRVLQVAEALEYLQTEAIPGAVVLHRDIRPDNVGIAQGGVVKIFDFGLSKALTLGYDGKLLCPMVGEAGSLRYAAPEVSMGLPHGGKADVYGWSLLAWSVASVRPPFEGIGRSAFYDRVVLGGERPQMDPNWPTAFQDVLRDSWNGDPSMRPHINQVVARMKALLKSLNGS